MVLNLAHRFATPLYACGTKPLGKRLSPRGYDRLRIAAMPLDLRNLIHFGIMPAIYT
ncbi:hypothetical protein AGR6A_pb0008 [Agrobacterium sp. NCPPB 925]|nr:hypothetical protein AGR6A_pb0008 [Agrobacterium sp. NCPPB 925]